MPTNLRQFINRLRQHRTTITHTVLPEYQRRTALDALRRVILKTPVDEGRARGNWQLTIGSPAAGPIEPLTIDQQFTNAQAAVLAAVTGDTYLISNSVPYIIRLENGWSNQAPQGMVGVTVAELRVEQLL